MIIQSKLIRAALVCAAKNGNSCKPQWNVLHESSERLSDEVICPVHAVWPAAGGRRFRRAD